MADFVAYAMMVKEMTDDISACCLGLRVGIIERTVTNLYDESLRPYGLRVGQMNLLVSVHQLESHSPSEGARPGDICRFLSLQRSTLSRVAGLLCQKGLLETIGGQDARTHFYRTTAEGRDLLRRAYPSWQAAQQRVQAFLGAPLEQALQSKVRELWG